MNQHHQTSMTMTLYLHIKPEEINEKTLPNLRSNQNEIILEERNQFINNIPESCKPNPEQILNL